MKNEIEKLVTENKLEEAFALFKKEFDKPLNPEEKSKLQAEIILAYLEATNKINTEYEKQLSDISEILKNMSLVSERAKATE